jgi:hypothetical protein
VSGLTAWRLAALFLILSSVVFVIGLKRSDGNIGPDRPRWLPPVWIRAGMPLAVAGGLWFGQRWAWWLATVLCGAMIVWFSAAVLVLALGGYFAVQGAAARAIHLGMLLGTWLAALVLLLWGGVRSIGAN